MVAAQEQSNCWESRTTEEECYPSEQPRNLALKKIAAAFIASKTISSTMMAEAAISRNSS